MAAFQILSDLHNEIFHAHRRMPPDIPATSADAVILAGDIDTGVRGIQWAGEQSQHLGKPIIYVAGNHEYYGHDHARMLDMQRAMAESSDILFLERDEIAMAGCRILGCTFWTDYGADRLTPPDVAMAYCQIQIADHRAIQMIEGNAHRPFRPADALGLHAASRAWLEARLSAGDSAAPVIVVTHHGPSALCQHPDFPIGPLSGGFHSNLDDLVLKADLWVYGHTHASLDGQFERMGRPATRLVSNQRGYPGEGVDFDAAKVVIIDTGSSQEARCRSA